MIVVVLLTGVVCLLAGCATSTEGVRVEGSPADTPTVRADPTDSAQPNGPKASEGTPRDGSGSAAPREKRATDDVQRPDTTRDDKRSRPHTDESARPVSTRLSERALVALLKQDPKVSSEVKRGLRPCVADRYPVAVRYERATGREPTDLVVNVTSCADSVGVGAYVYRRSSSGALVNVFAVERPPVSAAVRDGLLKVTRDVYIGNEPMCCPSGRDVATYTWRDGVFHEVARKQGDGDDAPPPEAAPGPAGGKG